MARMGSGGDLRGVKDEEIPTGKGGTVMPDGWHRFIVSGSDYRATKAGNGMCLHLTLTCLERNEFQNVEKRDFLVLEHPNADTMRIARAKLKGLALAVGHPNPDYVQDSTELHNKPVMVKLDIEEQEKYGKQNRVRAYMSVEDYRAKEGASNGGGAQAQSPPPPADEPPPHGDSDSTIPF